MPHKASVTVGKTTHCPAMPLGLNFEARNTDPHGYGNFDDAGGPGATQLLGAREPPAGEGGSTCGRTKQVR